MTRVVIGMSGGVDSSVAAGLLLESGMEVIGVTLHLWDYNETNHKGRCCAPEDQYDAKRVCDTLGIPHYTFDRKSLFKSAVVDRFLDEYLSGKTPSPCVRCNESVKLGPLWNIGQKLGADRVATGHYARVRPTEDGVDLRTAVDLSRDQSYFLFAAPMAALKVLELPLGEMTKPVVRQHGERMGLVNARKPDSTDLCFVEGQDYAQWVDAHIDPTKVRKGNVVTVDGEVLGEHQGIHHFTVGQRRGFGGHDGKKRYVLQIVKESATVVVGTDEQAVANQCVVAEMHWLVNPQRLAKPWRVYAKLRYRHTGVYANVEEISERDHTVRLTLATPQRGVAAGQAAVFYDHDGSDAQVLGGGWIE